MRTLNSIYISADPDTVFETASDIPGWARILPHYRWIHHVGGRGEWKIIEMAAWRSPIPIKWVSLTKTDPVARTIYFRHIGGLARGMEVIWTVDSAEGGTEVKIIHELSRLKVPVVRWRLGRLVLSRFFISHVADRTLAYMKRWMEAQCAGQSSRV